MKNPNEAREIFQSLDPVSQARILARIAHFLTMEARGSYEAGTDDVIDPVTLRRSNEVMHRIVSQIIALLKDDDKRFPDEVLLRIIDGLYPNSEGIFLSRALKQDNTKKKEGEHVGAGDAEESV